jgi:hypothetical protein
MVHNPSIPQKVKSIQRKTLKAKRFQGFFIFTLLPNNAVLSTLIVGLLVGDFIPPEIPH